MNKYIYSALDLSLKAEKQIFYIYIYRVLCTHTHIYENIMEEKSPFTKIDIAKIQRHRCSKK